MLVHTIELIQHHLTLTDIYNTTPNMKYVTVRLTVDSALLIN